MVQSLVQEHSESVGAYWVPGCSACLRMKEFLEESGIAYESINLEESPRRGEVLKKLGLFAPAVVVGNRAVPGLNLKQIADLIGYDYDPPKMLTSSELNDKFGIVMETVCRLTSQITPEGLEYKSGDIPAKRSSDGSNDQDHTLRSWVGHTASVMRAFVDVYSEDVFSTSRMWAPNHVQTSTELIAFAIETKTVYDDWWESCGFDDPLERVVKTFWGHRTLHEVLERSVWHTAQHARQIAQFLERLGVVPDRPLTSGDLAGLPIPDRVLG